MEQSVQVVEIFASIQGEGIRAGLPCAFVRLAGCNLQCTYCDTRYACEATGEAMSVQDAAERAAGFGHRLVCITGGEPMLQSATPDLARLLAARGLTVLVETNGAVDLAPLPAEAVRVMDVKCPGSGECGKMFARNLDALRGGDEAKFVLCDRADFEWAAEFVRRHGLVERCHVLFAPAHGQLAGSDLADWIIESGLHVRLQLQLHRILWPGRDRAV